MTEAPVESLDAALFEASSHFEASIDKEDLVYFLLNVGDGDTQLILLPESPADHRHAIVVDCATTKKLPQLIATLGSVGLLKEPPPGRAAVAARSPHFVIVANASSGLGWRHAGLGAIPWIGEILGLRQVKDVLYNNDTSIRRHRIIERFDADSPAGTLIHITTNPYKLPRAALGTDDETLKARAQAALGWLDGLGVTEQQWDKRVAAARRVGTQLWPLGDTTMRDVVNAAYVHSPPSICTPLQTCRYTSLLIGSKVRRQSSVGCG